MLKSEELRLPSSCLNRARDDEPLFVLLGRDPSAPSAIKAWCADRVAIGKNKADDAQIVEALAMAQDMRAYSQAPADRPAQIVDTFDFELGDDVELVLSHEKGLVIGRAEYLKNERCYYVRYLTGDGRQVDAWISESALQKKAQA